LEPAISQIIVVEVVEVGLFATVDRPGELWIDEIELVRGWQGRGIGTAILLDLLSAEQRVQKPVRLRIPLEKVHARRLYERFGFRITGETATLHLMERPVSS
jgi:GNAT superfamily N-acetyltransferase